MFKKSLHFKILFLTMGLLAAGGVISIFWELKVREQELLDEKLRASRFMARPVLNAIYKDMIEERADMARNLVKSLEKTEGVKLYILRSNGKEVAFKDLKTINAVGKERGEIEPKWLTDHPDEKENAARDAESPDFLKAYKTFKDDWRRGEVYYIDKSGAAPEFVYLRPIEKRHECNTCHSTEGARGILVIRTSLDDMYKILDRGRNQWIISGILAISLGGVLLSLVIRRSVTGPLRKNIEVIKRIAEGKSGISERVEVTSEDEIGYFATAFNDMLEALEKRADENRRLLDLVTKSRGEWVATFDAIQDLISIHDRDYRVIKVNKALAARLNARPEDLVGKKCHELFCCKDKLRERCPHTVTLNTVGVASAETDDLVFEGVYKITTFPVVNDSGAVWASVRVARDVTQEKTLREQLMQAEKLSSVGKLVAGIAHELNNPLMGIMGFSELLLDTPGDRKLDEIKGKLHKIYNESLRTAKIVQNLLAFAREKKAERKYASINGIINHTLELRAYSLRTNNIKVELDLDEKLPKTMVDPFQMQQIFINIINNAEDAMVAGNGRGTLRVKTRKVRGNIDITFTDDGPGIPGEIMNKVFDPFFTTKAVGKGTGLGLSITHGIITEHGGSIEIKSRHGLGAAVTILIPIRGQEQWVKVETGAKDHPRDLFSGKKILVVDDERSIREAVEDVLTAEGFKVETAREGAEALEALQKDGFALVITDIKMPGLDGTELYENILEKHVYLKDKIIVFTGDVFSPRTKDFIDKYGCQYLLKPFEMKELTGLVRKMLS